MPSEELTANEAMSEFYRMKGKYEEDVYAKYIHPLISNKRLSKNEKRQAFAKLPKPECINCKRNVGTIFTITEEQETLAKVFIAKCGDLAEPCPLNIQINYGVREQLNNIIEEKLASINKIKLDIIKEKNNLLFFTGNKMAQDESGMANFNKLTDELKDLTGDVGYYIEKNILVNDNPVKRDLLKKAIDEFGKEMLMPFKNLVTEFNEKGNEQIITEAIRFYKEEMMPKLREILQLKYDTTMVEYDAVSKEYKLLQIPHAIQNNESYFESDDKVVSFVKGVKKEKREKVTNTLKVKDIMTIKNNRTRKTNKLQNQNQNQTQDQQGEEENQDRNLDITSEAYINVYNKLPVNLKEELNKYPDWLNEFMDNCINRRKNKKTCDFIAPKGLILPPNQTPDTQIYDFGYEPFNKEFNGMSPESKQLYFNLVKVDEAGNADYSVFKDALTSLVSKRLGFQKIVM